MTGGTISVVGMPIPQGSKTAFVVNGRAVLTDGRNAKARSNHKAWREAVAREASLWCKRNGMPAPIDGPIELTMTFYLPRPKSTPKRVEYPATRPDLSKLLRAAEDSLSKIIYADDARVVDAHVSKRFAIDRPPGAEIRWQSLTSEKGV